MNESQLADKLESNFSSLSEYVQKDTQIVEFFESVSLVGSSILGLFANKGLTEIAGTALRIGTLSDVSRNMILSLSKKLNCHELLAYMEKGDPEGFSAIPPDFFNSITKNFARAQSIENYSKLLRLLFRIYGFQYTFLRSFYSISRDNGESNRLLGYIKSWDYSKLNFTFEAVASKAFLCLIERLSISNMQDELLKAFEDHVDLIPQIDNPEMIVLFNKAIFNAMLALIGKKDLKKTKEFLSIVLQPKYHMSLISINRILDAVNKNMISAELVDNLMQAISLNGYKNNIVTYNCYIESMGLLGHVDRAMEVLDDLKKEGLEPDGYTYSNLMKGLKNVPQNQLCHIHKRLFQSLRESTCRDRISINSMMDQCMSFNEDATAFEIFNQLKNGGLGVGPDNVSYNIYMKLVIKTKDVKACKELIEDYKRAGFKPNLSTFNSLLNMLLRQSHPDEVLQFFKALPDFGLVPDSFTFSIMLNCAKQFKFKDEDIRSLLEDIKDSMATSNNQIDEVVFNSILEILFSNNMLEQFDFFYSQMKKQNIPESSFTFSLILKKMSKGEDFEKIKEMFDEILAKKIPISDFNCGFILDFFLKNHHMDQALEIFRKLLRSKVELSSIIFTSIIKAFINAADYKTAYQIFKEVKHFTANPGIIITYNCALDLLIMDNRVEEALVLFQEIETLFKADLISYSTMVKGFCKTGRRQNAFNLIKKMMDDNVQYDVSIINLFLENCSANEDFKLGISSFEHFAKRKCIFNDISFGIMVKIYGASFKLKTAFDLLEQMEAFFVKPSLIFFTNLIHVSFFNKKPAKAELAATLMKKNKIKGDKLMYTKLIEGLLRFKQTDRVLYYVQSAIDDSTTLKQELIDQLFEIYEDEPEACQLIERVKYSGKRGEGEVKKEKLKNNFSHTNTQAFKNQIWQKNRLKKEDEQTGNNDHTKTPGPENPGRTPFGYPKKHYEKQADKGDWNNNQSKPQNQSQGQGQGQSQGQSQGPRTPKQTLILHNFRTNKKGE
jgi:pentatricopeptide repeat protein